MPDQGEIWTGPFPYFDNSGNLTYKNRPVLIVSNNEVNNNALDIIICQISRFEYDRILKLPKEIKSKVKVIANNDLDLNTSTRLRHMSIVRTYKLFSLSKNKLTKGKFIGKLKDEVTEEVIKKTKDLF